MPKSASPEIAVPSPHNWRTTDEDEINRRRARARTEEFRVANTDPRHPIFSNFRVRSGSGLTYAVEVRDLRQRQFTCECVDFHINGLGTCKHVEAVLLHLRARFKRLFRAAEANGPLRLEVVPDPANDSIRLLNGNGAVPRALKTWFDTDGLLRKGEPEEAIEALRQLDAGLLLKTTRASRPLWPAEAAEAGPPPPSAAELERISAHRERAARKLKMARVLCDAGLHEEARAALLDAVPPLGCALALQQRLPEPASASDALLPPLSPCWKEALPLLREFVGNVACSYQPVLDSLLPLAAPQ